MTEKKQRFTLKPYDGITCDVFDNGIEIANVHRDDAKGLCYLMNTLYEEKERFKKEAKHQQGQKQRLINYLKQYLSIKEINNIVNDDVWLDGDINE